MKKNLLTIIILALSLVNVILTVLIVFVVVPTAGKTNRLISQVASAVDLELGIANGESYANGLEVTDIEAYKVVKELQINLKNDGGDNEAHYALVDSVTLSMNKKAKNYKKLSEGMKTKEDIITDLVSAVFNNYTLNQTVNNREDIRKEILLKLQEEFPSDFIVDVSFGNLRAS